MGKKQETNPDSEYGEFTADRPRVPVEGRLKYGFVYRYSRQLSRHLNMF